MKAIHKSTSRLISQAWRFLGKSDVFVSAAKKII
jgi:hypothetical protein